MVRLICTPPATRDVYRLYKFLTPKNPDAVRRAVQAIRAAVKVVSKQPGFGRPMEDMPTEYREWIIDFGDSGYIVLYRTTEKAVYVLVVRHQREAGY